MIYCVLRGHNFVNEVQVTAQVFFPNEKIFFEKNFCENFSGYVLETFFEENSARSVVYKNGAEISRGEFCGEAEYLEPRRNLMLALYHALQKAVPTFTPWGALTGIRPSKPVREWIDGGAGDEEIVARLADPFCVSEPKARLAVAVAHAERRVAARISGTIGVYVNIPFCPSRCVYCSFEAANANAPAATKFLDSYIAALEAEIREKSAFAREMNAAVSSIYIGGGTPTFLSEIQLERVLSAVCGHFRATEFTVEAGRPDTLTAAKLKILRKYGANRIAVNPQTLNDRTLKAIGRNHTAADFFAAFHAARDAGFECINTDIIAGLPGESPDDMRRNMDALARLSPENITVHTLAVKRASRLKEERGEISAPRTVEAMLHVAAEACASAGLFPYYLYRQKNMVGLFENVGYSKPRRECLYNVGMMAEVQTILGAGAGAVTKFIRGAKITREFNAKNPQIYIERIKKGAN